MDDVKFAVTVTMARYAKDYSQGGAHCKYLEDVGFDMIGSMVKLPESNGCSRTGFATTRMVNGSGLEVSPGRMTVGAGKLSMSRDVRSRERDGDRGQTFSAGSIRVLAAR